MKKLSLLLCGALLLMLLPATVYANNERENENTSIINLSYAEALTLAIENLPSIQDLENAIEDWQEERDDLWDDYRTIRWLGNDELIRQMRWDLAELDRQMEHARLDIYMIELRTELALRNALSDIATTALDMQIAEETITIRTQYLHRVNRRHYFGLASARDVRAAQNRLTVEESRLSNLKITQSRNQNTLNHLLNQPPYQQTYVEFELELPEIPTNLSAHITNLAPKAPTILQLQMDIDRARYHYNRHRRICHIRPRRDCDEHVARGEAYARANLESDIAIRAIETALRAAYRNLEQLQDQAAPASLYQLQENLDIARVNLRQGRVTQFEVDNARFELSIAELEVEKILYQQWVLAFLLENPVLL